MNFNTPKAGLKTFNHRSDWQTARLKYHFRRIVRPVLESDEVITAFRDGTVTLRKNRREDGFTFAEQEIGYQGIEPGDLVIHAMDGFAGAIGVSDSRGKGSPVLTIATPVGGAIPQFWSYYLRNLSISGFIQSLAKGIRERSTDFRWKDASNLLVNFPDLPTQRAIADFLDRETARIDLLIEKKQRLLELLVEKRSALITSAVTGGFGSRDRLNVKGSGEVTVSWFKSLPLGWVSRRIKTISPVMRGASPRPIDDPIYFDDQGEYAWVRISDVTASDGLLKSTIQRLSSLGASMSVKLERGKLFLSIAGSVGKPCITDIKACIHDGFVYFPYLPVESQKFLYWIFESRECFSGLGKLGTQLNLNTETVGNIAVPFPDLTTQRAIADFLDGETARIDHIREKTRVSVDRLREYRSALITAAVTGQIDVTKWVMAGTADRKLDAIQATMNT